MQRKLENAGQKRTSNSGKEYRPYQIRAMRTRAGGISPHDEVWQSRKQITGDARHGLIKRVASAVVEGSIAIELVHQYLKRF